MYKIINKYFFIFLLNTVSFAYSASFRNSTLSETYLLNLVNSLLISGVVFYPILTLIYLLCVENIRQKLGLMDGKIYLMILLIAVILGVLYISPISSILYWSFISKDSI